MAESITRPSYEKVERKVEVMDTPYDRWISSQGVDVVRGFFVEDLYTIPLKPWDRMVHGFKGEEKIVKEWEAEFKIPIVTAAQTQVEALRALGVKRFVGVTYFTGSINDMFTRYFQEAGFDVLAMEGMEVAFADVGRLASTEIYAHTRRAFLKNPGADGVYMLGTGWRCLDIIHLLEEDLQVPVVHADRRRHIKALETRPVLRQSIDIRRAHYGIAIATEVIGAMLIGDDKEKVGSVRHSRRPSSFIILALRCNAFSAHKLVFAEAIRL